MKSFIPDWVWLGAAVVGAGGILASCARPSAPSGGPRDFIPPMIVSTWPDTFAQIEPTRDPVKIVFSERISERSTTSQPLARSVLVSPATGEYRVKHTRSGLEVELLGGFKPDLVYRVRLLPTIRDLFGNAMQGPFELVFSTGAPFEKNVVAGVVTDRISGEELSDARVEARDTALADPPVYLAATDSTGVFALRYLPPGTYQLTVFQDLNRNGVANYTEAQAVAMADPVGGVPEVADTVIIREVRLLRPDTIPARIVGVQAEDPLHVRIRFDDYLDTEGSLDPVQVRIAPEEGAELPIERLMWPRERDSLQAVADSLEVVAREAARRDSLQAQADALARALDSLETAGDTLAVDSVESDLDALLARLAPPEEEEEEAPAPEPAAPEPVLPGREFFVLMGDSLPPNVLLQVTVSDVTNLNDVGGGGGEASFTWEPPEEEAADTASAPPDTAQAVPDTAGVQPAGVRPDTVLPDTVQPDTVQPDTVSPDTVPPDTGAALTDPGPGRPAARLEPLWWLRRKP